MRGRESLLGPLGDFGFWFAWILGEFGWGNFDDSLVEIFRVGFNSLNRCVCRRFRFGARLAPGSLSGFLAARAGFPREVQGSAAGAWSAGAFTNRFVCSRAKAIRIIYPLESVPLQTSISTIAARPASVGNESFWTHTLLIFRSFPSLNHHTTPDLSASQKS
jgi:hypothetical protein